MANAWRILFITLETGQAILIERPALQAALEHASPDAGIAGAARHLAQQQSTALLASKQCEISERAETTYLKHHRRMLTLMLGQSSLWCPPYSSFKTQEALSRHWSPTWRHHGITERTLNGKFANARSTSVAQAHEVFPACMCNRGDCICNVFPQPGLLNKGHANKRHRAFRSDRHVAAPVLPPNEAHPAR